MSSPDYHLVVGEHLLDVRAGRQHVEFVGREEFRP
jgi:hypothetical protein